MDLKEKIIKLIFEAIDEINDTLPSNKKLKKSADEKLFGKEGKLDSLGLVNLIVQVESLLYDNLEIAVVIADEKAMSMNNSPFRDVNSLTEYIIQLMETDK